MTTTQTLSQGGAADASSQLGPTPARPQESGRWETGRSRWESRYVSTLVAVDGVVAALAGLLGVTLTGLAGEWEYWTAAAVFPFAWVAALGLGRAYESRFLGVGGEEYRRVFDSAVRLLAATAVVLVALKIDVARSAVVVVFPLAILLTLTGRYGARRALGRARPIRGDSRDAARAPPYPGRPPTDRPVTPFSP